MRFVPLSLLLLALFLNHGAWAAEGLPVARIDAGDRLTLADGRVIRLEGIKAPDEKDLAESARRALEDLIGGQGVTLGLVAADRYGRLAGEAYAASGERLQDALTRAGWAFVYPPLGTETGLLTLLRLEREARTARRGLWAAAAYADIAPENAGAALGRFAFVRGTVTEAARIKNKVYLNFGPDWRTDFTVEIAARDVRLFTKAGRDPLTLKDKTVRVRGLVQSLFGPKIIVTHPAQVEVVD